MTSAASVSMIVSAALLEAQDLTANRATLALVRGGQTEPFRLGVSGVPGWSYATESSSNLIAWSPHRIVVLTAPELDLVISNVVDAATFYRARIYFNP
jgi:hypothetical protein